MKKVYGILALLAGVAVTGVLLAGEAGEDSKSPNGGTRLSSVVSTEDDTTWTVGELRPDGLRIEPSGRSDAGAVLDPARFANTEVRNAYSIATRIPGMLNQLYCWCGCENRGIHRSNLECFEDAMAVNCAVCRGTAEIAYRMVTEEGITDAGVIQRAVDEEWAPEDAELWEM